LSTGNRPTSANAIAIMAQCDELENLGSNRNQKRKLRKAILQLAVMGKLVPQDPNDESASNLLEEIEVQKRLLTKEGKIKQPKPLPEIKLEERQLMTKQETNPSSIFCITNF
jgi:hypothetical protein